MNKKILIFAIILGLAALFSCETMDEPEMETTSTFPLNGEYWVTYSQGGTQIVGYNLLTLTNTAADDGKHILIKEPVLMVNEAGEMAPVVANANMDNLTFNVQGFEYPYNDTSIVRLDISDGKFWEDKYTTAAGNKTDSIYMNVTFNELAVDTNGNVIDTAYSGTFEISGYKRTGWPDDDH
ncbi:MAG: lipid-binding protein [Bacteroidales bacterium]